MSADIEICSCGLGPGYTCHPDCPAYKPPPPTEIQGTVSLGNTPVLIRPALALKSSYTSVSFGVADTQPLSLLGQDGQRQRAVIMSSAAVIVGKKSNLTSGLPLANIVGFPLPANVSLEIRNQDEVWAYPTGVAAIVSVMNERYE